MRNPVSLVAAVALLVAAAVAILVVPGDEPAPTVLEVTTSDDQLDDDPDGACSLREAIVAANTAEARGGCPAGSGGADTIVFAPDVEPRLSVAGAPEDAGHHGHLDVTSEIEISGLSIGGPAVVDGAGVDRVFDVHEQGTLRLVDATVTGGDAGMEAGGGGIRNRGTLDLVDSTVTGNAAGQGGGGILNEGTLLATGSTIHDNRAGHGGGIANASLGEATLRQVTVSGNRAIVGGGGGIDVASGRVTVESSTVTLNSKANGGAGGVRSETGEGVVVTRSIVADNADPQCAPGPERAVVSEGFNLTSDGSCDPAGTDLTDASPRLRPLRSEAGATATHVPEAGSPAIDAVPAASCPLEEDQRGGTRPQLEGRPCDIGAVEVAARAEVTTSSVTTSTIEAVGGTSTTTATTEPAPTTTEVTPTTTSSTTTTTVEPTEPAVPRPPRPPDREPAPPLPGEPRVTG